MSMFETMLGLIVPWTRADDNIVVIDAAIVSVLNRLPVCVTADVSLVEVLGRIIGPAMA